MGAESDLGVGVLAISRSRSWTDSAPLRLPSRRPVPSVRLRPFPRAPVRFAHAWSRSSSPGARPPTGRPCIAAPWNARPNSKPRSTASKPCFGSASSNSSDARPRPPRRPPRRPRMRPTPVRRHPGLAASSPVGPGPNDAITPTSRLSPRIMSCPPSRAVAHGAVSPSPTSPAPRMRSSWMRSSWRSRSGPIAGSFAATAIGPLVPVPRPPAWSPPRRRPG